MSHPILTQPRSRKRLFKDITTSSGNQMYISRRAFATEAQDDRRLQKIAALGLVVSVGSAVAAIVMTQTHNPESDVELEMSADGKSTFLEEHFNISPQNLRRFDSFSTMKLAEKVKPNLVASVVAETISKDALRERYDFGSRLDSGPADKEILGNGSFGRVVRGKDKLSDIDVAIKIVPHENMSADAIFNEIDVLRRVRGHENIVHLHQVLNCDKNYYLITELCDSGELLDVLLENGPYPEAKSANLIEKLTLAVQHVHNCGYIHGDIKPENIVFGEPSPGSSRFMTKNCRIIDFGVATSIEGFQISENVIGTTAYAAPELIDFVNNMANTQEANNFEDYDPRAIDLWSLGIVLYITLLGCHPFDIKGDSSEEEVAWKILNEEVNFNVHGERLIVSKEAKDFISKLLKKDPKERLTVQEALEHDFIKKNSSSNERLLMLPSSWVDDGFSDSHGLEKESKSVDKLFSSELVIDTFVRALLITALVNSLNGETEDIAAEEFLRQAFKLLDKKKRNRVSLKDVKDLYISTGSASPEKWMQEVNDSLDNEEISIDFNQFKSILNNFGCVTRKFRRNIPMFSQGDEPQGFYVLTRGNCVLQFTKSKKQSPITTFSVAEAGSMFGESALEQGRSTRAVTVKTVGTAEVAFIPKSLFFKALAGSPALQKKMFEATRLQQAQRLKDLVQAQHMEVVKKKFKHGDYLYKAGDEPAGLYFIENGIVLAFSDGQEDEQFAEGPMTMRLAQRGSGDITGSSVFFKKGKRYCSVQCLTDVEVSLLKKSSIDNMMRHNQPLQFYLESQAQWRKDQWNQRLVDVERGITEPQLLPILMQQEKKNKGVAAYAKAVTEMDSRIFKAGEAVYIKGDKPDKFYIINSGTAVVEMSNDTGEKMAIAQVEPGDHFGEGSLLEELNQQAMTVRCVVPCEILSMNRKDFFRLMENQTQFSNAVEKAARMRNHRWGRNLLALANQECILRKDHQTSENLSPLEDEEIQVDLHLAHGQEEDMFFFDSKSSEEDSCFGPSEHASEDDAAEVERKEDDFQVEKVTLTKGQTLFKEGDLSSAIFYVHSGNLILSSEGDEEHKVIEPGDALGLESISYGLTQKRSCVCASQEAVLSKIPKETLEHLIDTNDYISSNLKKHFVEAAPLRDLERNLEDNVNQLKQRESNREIPFFSVSRLSRFGSFNSLKSEPRKKSWLFSEMMEELSKARC